MIETRKNSLLYTFTSDVSVLTGIRLGITAVDFFDALDAGMAGDRDNFFPDDADPFVFVNL